jgi:hypothetical protein
MGGPLVITDQELKLYCYQSLDNALTARQRLRLAEAIVQAESAAVLVPAARSDYPRLIRAHVLLEPAAPGDDAPPACVGVSVIRQRRYAVRKREAPKRPTLLRRLWSALR